MLLLSMEVAELLASYLFPGSCMWVLRLGREEYSGMVTAPPPGWCWGTTLLVPSVSCSGQSSGPSFSLVPYTTSRY